MFVCCEKGSESVKQLWGPQRDFLSLLNGKGMQSRPFIFHPKLPISPHHKFIFSKIISYMFLLRLI